MTEEVNLTLKLILARYWAENITIFDCGSNSAVSIELRNSGVNSIPLFSLSFTELWL